MNQCWRCVGNVSDSRRVLHRFTDLSIYASSSISVTRITVSATFDVESIPFSRKRDPSSILAQALGLWASWSWEPSGEHKDQGLDTVWNGSCPAGGRSLGRLQVQSMLPVSSVVNEYEQDTKDKGPTNTCTQQFRST